MSCAFTRFPKAHQRRKGICAFNASALGKNLKAQGDALGVFPKRTKGAPRQRGAALSLRLLAAAHWV
jgi:hypothetical protein